MDKGELTANLVNVLGPIAMAGLAWLGVWVKNLIKARTKNEWLKGALVRLDDTVLSVVRELEQTVVGELKEAAADGVISPEERAKVKQDAINLVKRHLGAQGLLELAKVFGLDGPGLEALISTKIEAAVHMLRSDEPLEESSPH